jgi:4a-hydroxytetrahydrobiopterin dehydratase
VSELAKRRCVPCRGGVPPLRGAALEALHAQLDPGWSVVKEHHLEKEYRFKDFADALAFVNRVGGLAEDEQHHPDLVLTWGKVRVAIWTHKIDGLTESDFVFAAKTDELV